MQSRGVEFPCGNCGALMTWDPADDAMACAYCDNRVAVPRAEGTIVERPLAEAGTAARGLGVEVRVVQCEECGARVTFEETSTAEFCVYCGSSQVLAQEANRNAIRPESLVPLDVSREAVEQRFREWVGKLWFRPNALKKARPKQAIGVYVPFWTFDCEIDSDWSADAGHYYYVTQTYWVTVGGRRQRRTRRVRKIRWVPAWGSRHDSYDDVLVPGSKGLPDKLLRKLGGFDTTDLVPYRPEYLAGWRAEEYQVDLETAWGTGRQQIEASQRNRCAGDVPGDTYRRLQVQNKIYAERWKHVLLPLWSVAYAYKSETYTVLIQGQSGRIVGEAPLSWTKILLALGAVAAAVGTLMILSFLR